MRLVPAVRLTIQIPGEERDDERVRLDILLLFVVSVSLHLFWLYVLLFECIKYVSLGKQLQNASIVKITPKR